MLFSIQYNREAKSWDETQAVLFTAAAWKEAVAVAHEISADNGNVTVRLVELSNLGLNFRPVAELQKYIGQLSGSYIQSK